MAPSKPSDSEVHPDSEHEHFGRHKNNMSISEFIAYFGNTVIMLEFILIVLLSAKTILHIGGWEGIALVVFMLPAYILIFLLTHSLKHIFMRKYATSGQL